MNARQALDLLKEGYILRSEEDDILYYFSYENKKVKVYTAKYNLTITGNDFLDTYGGFIFNAIKGLSTNSLDNEKDFDYYSRLQKKQ